MVYVYSPRLASLFTSILISCTCTYMYGNRGNLGNMYVAHTCVSLIMTAYDSSRIWAMPDITMPCVGRRWKLLRPQEMIKWLKNAYYKNIVTYVGNEVLQYNRQQSYVQLAHNKYQHRKFLHVQFRGWPVFHVILIRHLFLVGSGDLSL